MSSRREQLLALAILILLAPGLIAVSRRVLQRGGLDRPYDVAYVPRPTALKLLSPGIQLSVADLHWLEAVQYIGEPNARQRGFEKLYPLIDLVTELDPRHGYAYQTGGIVLSGQGRIDESDRILKKGMGPGKPNWWTFPFYLAFNDYFVRGDYASAARWAEIAARTPGASPHISHLAMALDVKSGSPDEAVHFLEELRAEAHDDATAAALEEQYKLALLQRAFALLDRAVADYRSRAGTPPRALEDLVTAGVLGSLPTDPFGGRFFLDAQGEVHASVRDQRFRARDKGQLELFPSSHPKPDATP